MTRRCAASAQSRRRSAPRRSRRAAPAASRPPTASASSGAPGQVRADRGRRERSGSGSRPCGTSPGRARRSRRRGRRAPPPGERPADGDERGPGAGAPAPRSSAAFVAAVAALVRDADDEAARRRVERQLEGLGRRRRRRRPGRPRAAASRRISAVAERARARTCRSRSRRPARRRAPSSRDRRGQRRRLASPAGVAGEDPAGQRRLGRDHVGHVVRRAGAPARACRCEAHGSGGPGRGAVGSKAASSRRHRSEDRRAEPPGRRPRGAASPPRPRDAVAAARTPPRVTMAPRGPDREERMQVGLMAPQGWKGEYDGWDAADGVGADRRARARRPRRSASSRCGSSTTSTRSRDPTDEITFESFSILAALAMATTRVRLGHMVVCTGFRNPALTAKLSSTLDVISGGRFELGIGAGWKEDEWRAYGYGFPTIGERMGALGDHLEVITPDARRRAARPTRATYAHVRGAINVPKGIQQPHIPIIVGGNGERRTAGYAIRTPTSSTTCSSRPTRSPSGWPRSASAARAEGRDPATLRFSLYTRDEAGARRRARRGSTSSAGWPRSGSTGSSASRPAGRRRSRRRRRSPRTAGPPVCPRWSRAA